MHTSTSDAAFEERMQAAELSKQAGNAALAAGNTKSASFHYKKVYLHLAEYLPANIAASALASATSSPPPIPKVGEAGGEGAMTDNDAANGLVGFLQQRRKTQLQKDAAPQRDDDVAAEAARQHRLYALFGSTLNNLTLVHYKLGRYREGVATATCLLNRIPGFELSPKALLRRAYCYVALEEPLLAEVNAKELDKVVTLAAQRCNAPVHKHEEEDEGRTSETTSPRVQGGEKRDDSDLVIEGLGGMTVAAVAAMRPEVVALHDAIAALKKAAATREKEMYQKMFSAS